MNKILSSIIILAVCLSSCDSTRIVVKPPILPIAVVFSKDGIDFEFQLGVQIPYIGEVSLETPLNNNNENTSASRTLYVNINNTAHEYNIDEQRDKKFERIKCQTSCEISVDISQNGSIIISINDIGSSKNAVPLLNNTGHYDLNLIVTVDNANIRSEPDTSRHNENGGAKRNEILKSDGKREFNGEWWYRVIVPPGNYGAGEEGWIHSSCVQELTQ